MRYSIPLLLFVGSVLSAQPAVESLSSTHRVWEKSEWRLSNAPVVENPFDPELIALDLVVESPAGSLSRVPAFWYQGFSRQRVDGKEVLAADGDPEWRVRFTPRIAGRHVLRWEMALGGGVAFEFAWTEVMVEEANPAASGGFVRVASDGRTFETTVGVPLPLIGANVCWDEGGGTYDYERWFEAMTASGQNFARLWLSPWSIGLEHGPGTLNRYDQEDAWRMDYLFAMAERLGIYLMISMDHHGMYQTNDPGWAGTNNFWSTHNPYSSDLGGPCDTPDEFFSKPLARKIYQKRLRYMIGRYGYSQMNLAWQFFNEIDNVYRRGTLNPDDVVDWHREMAMWLKNHDPNRLLITTSLTGGSDREEFWTIPEIDFANYHSYFDPNPAAKIASLSRSFVTRYRKPVMIGEFGTSARTLNVAADPHLRGFRQGLWGGALGGSVGSSLSWWWEDLHRENLMPVYASMGRILDVLGWRESGWSPMVFPNAPEPIGVGDCDDSGFPYSCDLALNPFSRVRMPGEVAIVSPLSAERASEKLSRYLWAPDGIGDLGSGMTINARFGEGGKIRFRVDSVSGDGTLSVKVDRAEMMRMEFPDADGRSEVNGKIDRVLDLDLEEGLRRIELANVTGEWINLSSVRLENVLPCSYDREWSFGLESVGLRKYGRAIVYLYSPHVAYPANALRLLPPMLEGEQIVVQDWPAGSYDLSWWDPMPGKKVHESRIDHEQDGAPMVVAVPSFNDDLVLGIMPSR